MFRSASSDLVDEVLKVQGEWRERFGVGEGVMGALMGHVMKVVKRVMTRPDRLADEAHRVSRHLQASGVVMGEMEVQGVMKGLVAIVRAGTPITVEDVERVLGSDP